MTVGPPVVCRAGIAALLDEIGTEARPEILLRAAAFVLRQSIREGCKYKAVSYALAENRPAIFASLWRRKRRNPNEWKTISPLENPIYFYPLSH